ncbi:MAG: glycosyltransferase family 4 protein [Gammaproteobacteria bacterium]|nr:glycosyltransferase family 4 protein [Gammaproteobacteria bacterium]
MAADLVIVEHAARLLINYPLVLRRKKTKLAFWGHGRNFQRQVTWLERLVKGWLARSADWWFAYSASTALTLQAEGVPANRVTVVNNAIDSKDLESARRTITSEDIALTKAELGITGANIGIYCGRLYRDKDIQFLLDSCRLVKEAVPDFALVIVGEGPDEFFVKSAAQQYPWIHFVGPRYGADLARYLLLSKVMLMPSAVGLAIVDSFILETPIVTTNNTNHGPEISYLEPGVNGALSDYDTAAFAATVGCLLCSETELNILRQGCKRSAITFTVGAMAERFVDGILRCIGNHQDIACSEPSVLAPKNESQRGFY